MKNPHFISSSLCSSLLSSDSACLSIIVFMDDFSLFATCLRSTLRSRVCCKLCNTDRREREGEEKIDNCEHRTHHHQEAGGIWAQLESFFFINWFAESPLSHDLISQQKVTRRHDAVIRKSMSVDDDKSSDWIKFHVIFVNQKRDNKLPSKRERREMAVGGEASDTQSTSDSVEW